MTAGGGRRARFGKVETGAKGRKMRGRVTPAAPRHEPAVIFAYKKLFLRDNLLNAKLAGILQPRLSGDM